MKKKFLTTIIILLIFLVSLMTILSTVGFKTDRFNKFITDKIIEKNKSISLELEEIKFKFDFKDFDLFLETKNPKLIYKNIEIPIEYTKVYLDFISIIKSNPKIDKINITSREINIDQLKKIMIKTKPSNLNSIIRDKVKNGQLKVNLELYLNDNLKIDNFIARGEVKDMEGIIVNNLIIKNTSFSFFSDSSDIIIKNLKSKMDGIVISNGNLQIKKNQEISLQSDFNTEIKINKKNIMNYSPFIKNIKFINQETKFNGNLDNFLNITFDKTLKIINYAYTNKGKINELLIQFDKSIKNSFLEKDVEELYFKNSNFNARYASDKKNYIYISGDYSIDNKNFQNYDFKNDFVKESSNINLNFEFAQKLNIDFINYEKSYNKIAKIILNLSTKKDLLNLKELKYSENKNLVLVENLKIEKKI